MFDQLSDQEIELIKFMADNLEQEINPYKHIHKKLVDKSTWKPNRVHQSVEIFQRSFNLGIFNSKIKTVHKPEIIIKKQTKAHQW